VQLSEDTLSPPAPTDVLEVPGSVDPIGAPGDGGPVVEASGQEGEKLIPAARFNGLMSKFNQTQDELTAEREAREALELRLHALETTQFNEPQAEVDVSEVAELQEQVAALGQMLMEERLEAAKAKALAEFPEAAAFSDLIQASDPREYRAMAEEIASRIKGSVAEGSEPPPATPVTSSTPVEPPVNPDIPVGSGGPGFVSEAPAGTAEDAYQEALKKRDFHALIKAKEALAAGADLVLEG
jgi:hypothetical protein